MINLLHKRCIPCEGGMPSLKAEEIKALQPQVPNWEVVDGRKIKRRFIFKNFANALTFVNKVGALAEQEGHHPDISFGWGYVEITTLTHASNGLTENDFILATKIDSVR